MAATLAEGILDHIYANVIPSMTGIYDGTSGVSVARHRALPYELSEHPAIVIRGGPDEVREGSANMAYIDRSLTVFIDIYVKSNGAYYANLDYIRSEVYGLMMASRDLGLTYVMDTLPAGDDEPELATLEKPAMKQTMTFNIYYRHNINSSSELS